MSANKSFSSETSERYARALFELSKESNELEKTEKNISDFKLWEVMRLKILLKIPLKV